MRKGKQPQARGETKMTINWTNPETGKSLVVFIHEIFELCGQTVIRVNKGTKKTHYVFLVRMTDTDLIAKI
jgi:hypothetical protein